MSWLRRRRRQDQYPAGSCTRVLYDTVPWVPLGWGDAWQWVDCASQAGLSIGVDPAHGALAVWQPSDRRGPYGHVAYVCAVEGDGQFCVYERDWNAVPGTSMVWCKTSEPVWFIYPPAQVHTRLPRGPLHNGRGADLDPIVSVAQAYETMRGYYNIGAAFQLLQIDAVGIEFNTLL